ncbi:MAG: hypothetical protein A3I61_06615 [Acidobacteria bacterium RIFCSPLOWO2_02_FULL_68_18]|nr:MAG: hypothetical protein A3I61_06615 [Acidobacteria bacterium RIFCSPLOWO2_02_FULL_68_18]OFW50326.1 MAG: hypothetical protein A3G77_07610 [Acidobacteria bacterium RIFCSPLOWO2_12_FULL_68_19]
MIQDQPTDTTIPVLSVVVPLFCSVATLAELHARLTRVVSRLDWPSEIILIDDACPRGSGEVAERLAGVDAAVRVVRLAKNVGQHRAALIGISHARGDRIVVIDADLQDPPEALVALVRALEDGYDAVFARFDSRAEAFGRAVTSRMFKTIVNPLLYGIPAATGMFLAITGRMRLVLLSFETTHVYLPGLIGLSGLPHCTVSGSRVMRPAGRSAYTAWKRLRFAWHVMLCWAECRVSRRRGRR